MVKTIQRYQHEIDDGIFPGKSQTNIIEDAEYHKIREWCVKNHIKV